jgi:phosphatidylinositol-3-phosphatase
MMTTKPLIALFCVCLFFVAACDGNTTMQQVTPGGSPGPTPHFAHIVVVIEENHSYQEIIESTSAPYINQLAQQWALFTDSHGVAHPSEPNYLALFAGSTYGLASDACPLSFDGSNLATALSGSGLSFTGYSASMPSSGFTGCSANTDAYARKHNPWVDFKAVPASSNQSFDAFPSDYGQLPAVAYVVPDQYHDMHSGSIADGDAWLRANLDGYIQWAQNNNSLCIITWDEDDGSQDNHIPTIFIGAHVKPGTYPETINHFAVLKTIAAIEGVTAPNDAANAKMIADIWQ